MSNICKLGSGERVTRVRGSRQRVVDLAVLIATSGTLVVAACNGTGDAQRTDDSQSLSTIQSKLSAADVPLTATELVGRPTDTSVTVNAIATRAVEAYFEYGTTAATYGTTTPVANFPSGTIATVIQGLSPNTRYYYRMRYRPVGSTEQFLAGSEHSFQTQRARNTTFTFAVQSDSHQGYAAFYNAQLYATTMQNILGSQPDFLLDLGDAFSLDDTPETEATVRQKYLNQRSYFGTVGHSTPIFLVLGNHENEEGWNLDDMGTNRAASLPVLGANARKRYFLNPVPNTFYTGNSDPLAELDGDHLREDYYAFEWGDALFVAIDPFWYTTRKPFTGTTGGEKDDEVVGNRWDWTLGRTQYLWLKSTLEQSTAAYKFIFTHQLAGGTADYSRAGARGAKYCEWGGYNTDGTTYAFATQRAGWEMPIHQLLVKNNVTAVFHGHDHIFAKEVLDGVVYQEVPHAANADYGSGFSSNQTDYAGATTINNSGYVRVTVAPAKVTVDYVRSYLAGAGTNGSVAHSYTITSCATRDSDSDGTNDCADLCPTDATKVAPGACGCGIADTDSNGNGTADCLETSCSNLTLVSNDSDQTATIGSSVRWTAGAQCGTGTPTYQFRIRGPLGYWRVGQAYSTSNVFNWSTAGFPAGTCTIELSVRRSGSTAPYEAQTTTTFQLVR